LNFLLHGAHPFTDQFATTLGRNLAFLSLDLIDLVTNVPPLLPHAFLETGRHHRLEHLTAEITELRLDLIGPEFEIGLVVIEECFEDEGLRVIKSELIDEERKITTHEVRLELFHDVAHAGCTAHATTHAAAHAASTTTASATFTATTTAAFTTAAFTATAFTATATTAFAVAGGLCSRTLGELQVSSKASAQGPTGNTEHRHGKKVPDRRMAGSSSLRLF
jgi:hypothetical protein